MTTFRTTAPSVTTAPVPAARSRWSTRYARRLSISDTIIVAAVIILSRLLLITGSDLISSAAVQSFEMSYSVLSVLLAVVWLIALQAGDSRDEKEIGSGLTEYRRVLRASITTFVLLVAMAFFTGFELSRLWMLTVIPAGTVALLLSRWGWRQWLAAKRRQGLYTQRAILLGSSKNVVRTAVELDRKHDHGYSVVGVALTDGGTETMIADLPIVGDANTVAAALQNLHADTIIATGGDLESDSLRDLAWHLAPHQRLIVSSALSDMGNHRVYMRPVAGLPLIHVETPHIAMSGRFVKRAFDLVVSSALLFLLAPTMLLIGFLVRQDSPGGVFYRQVRVGRNGEPFSILKFRSMSADSDARLAELVSDHGDEKGLFKMKNDPRVTKIGAVLRRYSLDELPQLINVLKGEMSLVGPRPALPTEVSEYDRREMRRLAVTPGLSGLWQVSGRSNLSWLDGIRLDLYYVENWSLTQDLQILVRTARAVLKSDGAY
jgi:exopolysaccharide biosynthesis polyprenyl glycosylphosphotransferase